MKNTKITMRVISSIGEAHNDTMMEIESEEISSQEATALLEKFVMTHIKGRNE